MLRLRVEPESLSIMMFNGKTALVCNEQTHDEAAHKEEMEHSLCTS